MKERKSKATFVVLNLIDDDFVVFLFFNLFLKIKCVFLLAPIIILMRLAYVSSYSF